MGKSVHSHKTTPKSISETYGKTFKAFTITSVLPIPLQNKDTDLKRDMISITENEKETVTPEEVNDILLT